MIGAWLLLSAAFGFPDRGFSEGVEPIDRGCHQGALAAGAQPEQQETETEYRSKASHGAEV